MAWKSREARNAYQREYMRRYRAAGRDTFLRNQAARARYPRPGRPRAVYPRPDEPELTETIMELRQDPDGRALPPEPVTRQRRCPHGHALTLGDLGQWCRACRQSHDAGRVEPRPGPPRRPGDRTVAAQRDRHTLATARRVTKLALLWAKLQEVEAADDAG